jgi:dienelactone hydrolase
MRQLGFGLLVACALLLAAACAAPPSTPATAPTAGLPATAVPGDLPAVVEYNLGEATIVQERFPEDSRFRNMPVRLNGLIAVPPGADGPYPVVVILHGTHPGCPVDEMEVDRWPCDPEVERANYQGFEYLGRELAARGYVALSININAENTFGFGEPVAGERLQQLVDLHLRALAEAAAGGDNDFGVELAGRADLGRLALFGHSRGGDAAYWLAHTPEMAADAAASKGYGPVHGLLLIAPAVASFYAPVDSRMPMAVILPACDGDVVAQEGQHFFEGARLAPQQTEWVTSAWLEGANHNFFNQLLPDDPFGRRGRPDCETLLEPEAQRGFLVDYAADFLATLFAEDATAVSEAMPRLGMDVQALAPGELYGLPARVALLAPAAGRQPLLVPATADELVANRLGGSVTEEGITTHFCPEGYYTPAMLPGSEPCRRVNVTIPGQPAHAVISWEELGGAWRFALPAGTGDLSGYTALSLRAAVDPLSPLNAPDTYQAFSVQLTDRAGNSATVRTRPDEPALGFPTGLVEEDTFFGELFTGRVPMTTIRLLLSDFDGVDLTNISEIALLFDQTASGSLFVGDLELNGPW